MSATAHQTEINYKATVPEPFYPALERLESGEALPPDVRLTQAAKRLYSRFLRQHLAAASKGRELFRAKARTLAQDLQITERTVYRALDQLRAAGLLQSVRTGRSSFYRLLPLPAPPAEPEPPPDVDKSRPPDSECQIRTDIGSDRHKESSLKLKPIEDQTAQVVDNFPFPAPENDLLLARIDRRLEELKFRYHLKGHKRPLNAGELAQRFDVSYLLSWLEKAEDGALEGSLRNPAAWLRKALERCLKRRLAAGR